MPLSTGAKIHVSERRAFEEDIRRHFVGQIEAINNSIARARGYAFVYHPGSTTYIRSKDERTRIVPLADANLLIRVLPIDANVNSIEYRSEEGVTVVTDGATFELEINDFGANR